MGFHNLSPRMNKLCFILIFLTEMGVARYKLLKNIFNQVSLHDCEGGNYIIIYIKKANPSCKHERGGTSILIKIIEKKKCCPHVFCGWHGVIHPGLAYACSCHVPHPLLATSTCNPPCEQWLTGLGAGAGSFILCCWAYLVCLPFVLVVLPSLQSSACFLRSLSLCCRWCWVGLSSCHLVTLPALLPGLTAVLVAPVSTLQRVAHGRGWDAACVVLVVLFGHSHSTQTTLQAYACSSGGQVLMLIVSILLHPQTVL